jgi:hypothetical protein
MLVGCCLKSDGVDTKINKKGREIVVTKVIVCMTKLQIGVCYDEESGERKYDDNASDECGDDKIN